jgi:hypothetical protein
MSVISLHPNNKNQFRKLPLKSTSSFTSDDGYQVTDDIIVNCSITTIYGRHRVYIKQIFVKASEVKIAIASFDPASEIPDLVLGVFSGTITEDFTTIYLTPFVRNVSGYLTIGSLASLAKINRTLNFSSEFAELEESKIFCYIPPAVSSITDKQNNELRGIVDFGQLINLTKTTTRGNTQFLCTAPETVANLADNSSFLGTCKNPIIKTINGVYPSPFGKDAHPENDANIYIVGVKPIVFYGIPGVPGVLSVDTTGVTLDSLCAQRHKLLPPIDVRGFTENSNEAKNKYYNKFALPSSSYFESYPYEIPARLASNFNAALRPEYYYWPQFVKKEYYAYWKLTAPSVPLIISTIIEDTQVTITFTPPINSGEHAIDHYEYALSLDGITFESFVPCTPPENRLVVSGLTTNTKYWLVLRAIDTENALGETSLPVYFTTTTV